MAKRQSECCPDKPHFAKGKCRNCYMRDFRAARPAYREESKQVYREWRYRTQYGMTAEDVKAMLEAQQSRCACCGKEICTSTLKVDHCHSAGYVRGLLCHECNTGIGMLGDSVEGVSRAIAYLSKGATAFRAAS